MDKNIKIVILLIVVVGLLGLLLIGSSDFNSDNELRIGGVLQLTGDYAFVGNEVHKGIEIALDEVTEFKPVFIPEDDQFDAAKSVSAAQKLINIDKTDVVLTVFSEQSQPMGKIFDDSQIPLLTLWDSNKKVIGEFNYVFSNGFSTEDAGYDMAEFAFKKLELRNVAIVNHLLLTPVSWAESFTEKFIELGGQIHSRQEVSFGEDDFRTIITKASNADGIYFPVVTPLNIPFVDQIRELGIDMPLMTTDGMAPSDVLELGSLADGIYQTQIHVDNIEELENKYINKYGSAPEDIVLVSFGYEGVKLIEEAYRLSPDDIQKGLIKILGDDKTVNKIEKLYQIRFGQLIEL